MQDRFLIFIARHAHKMPESAVRAVFAVLAWIVWALRLPPVRQLEKNIRHTQALRDPRISYRRLRHLSRLGVQSYFAYFAEAMTIKARSAEQINARVRIDGPYAEAIARQPAVSAFPTALGHQGNWDYAALWAYGHIAPVATVTENLKNKELLDIFISIRESLGITLFTTGDRDITERLKKIMGSRRVIVPLLADRDLGRHGIFVRFFDSCIRASAGPTALAFDMDVPLYVVNIYRERLDAVRRHAARCRFGYVLYISGVIQPDSWKGMGRAEALQQITQEWAAIYSQGLEKHPQDWHMMQPIFLEDLDKGRLR